MKELEAALKTIPIHIKKDLIEALSNIPVTENTLAIVADEHNKILFYSEQLAHQLSYNYWDLLGMNIKDLITPALCHISDSIRHTMFIEDIVNIPIYLIDKGGFSYRYYFHKIHILPDFNLLVILVPFNIPEKVELL